MNNSKSRPSLPELPKRNPAAHKGDFGFALVVAGSRGMAGAAMLAGTAALRTGAGLVRVVIPSCIAEAVASYEPSYLTYPMPSNDMGRFAPVAAELLIDDYLPTISQRLAVAIGPGLGLGRGPTDDDPGDLVERIFRNLKTPVVVDADALNILVANLTPLNAHRGARILTPHPGEFLRILKSLHLTKENSLPTRLEQIHFAQQIAAENNLILILKGRDTYITDGEQDFVNPTGNPGMATGGSGDVLTGVLVALLAQGMEPFDAAKLGCYLHGLAGDLAAKETGEVSLIASDLLSAIPTAMQELAK